jgi:hypothetical protein
MVEHRSAIILAFFLVLLATLIEYDNPPKHEPANPAYQENGP